jgi:hypothetical protein
MNGNLSPCTIGYERDETIALTAVGSMKSLQLRPLIQIDNDSPYPRLFQRSYSKAVYEDAATQVSLEREIGHIAAICARCGKASGSQISQCL